MVEKYYRMLLFCFIFNYYDDNYEFLYLVRRFGKINGNLVRFGIINEIWY